MKAISACLCGVNCRYNGKNNRIHVFYENRDEYLMICPELEAGLDIPREAVEIIGEIKTNAYDDLVSGMIKVCDKNGRDYSASFILGAEIVVERILKHQVKEVILKENSPSCGSHSIYNGHFNEQTKSGHGILTALLMKHGIKVTSI